LEIIQNQNKRWKKNLLISTPTLGLVRFEWAHARYSQIIPVNWESTGFDVKYDSRNLLTCNPVGFSIEDAYNLVVKKALDLGVEWVLTIEDDVLIPPDCFLKMTSYIDKGEIPIVSGLYYLKATPTAPLVFRGRGNGAFIDFKIGKKVWCDGVPMGCLLIHISILKYLWENSPEYKLSNGEKANKVFETPRKQFIDPQTGGVFSLMGTQDLFWCDRILDDNVLKHTGWNNIARRKYPFLVDTSIFCKHIDLNTGVAYP
jgi:hypothetical protein